jgi:hypothetical protein
MKVSKFRSPAAIVATGLLKKPQAAAPAKTVDPQDAAEMQRLQEEHKRRSEP